MFDYVKENAYVILTEAAESMGISLSERQIDLLVTYVRELLFWNQKMSLVSLKGPQDIMKHLIDSLTPVPLINDAHAHLVDIGTGAGLPGIPLKIQMGSIHVTLIESSRKKTSFLKHAIRTLGIEDIAVVNSRAQAAARENQYRGTGDVVISRAAFDLSRLLVLGAPFLSDGGVLIAMKGQRAGDELARAEDTLHKTGLVLTGFHETRLPVTGEIRTLLCFTKKRA